MKNDSWINELDFSKPNQLTEANLMSKAQVAEIQSLKNSGFNSAKYHKAQKTYTKLTIHELHKKNPKWGLKEILVNIIYSYPSEMPIELYSEMTQFIIEEWNKIMVDEAITA